MKELSVPHKQSLDLKELGFDESCFGFYLENGEWRPSSYSYAETEYPHNFVWPYITAPTYSQVFDWFRKMHNLHAHVKPYKHNKYELRIHKPSESEADWEQWSSLPYDSHREAEIECIDRMIEIIKNI
jgi:hypothetical protein